MKKLLIAVTFFIAIVGFASEDRQVINVGVRAFNGVQSSYQKWTPTLKYLDDSQNSYSFHLVPVFGFQQMRELIANKEIDFVITQPAEAVILKEKYKTRIFLTFINKYNDQTFAYFSAAIFTRGDRKDINTIMDIKGKKFAAIDPEGLGAYWMGLRELRRAGLKEDKDFTVIYRGTQDNIVDAVLDKTADVGTVRSGIIEGMIKRGLIKNGDLKIIHPVIDGLPLMHSTDLYPEWTLSARDDISSDIVIKIQRALTNMQPDSPVLAQSGYGGWMLPVNYSPVYDLMRELHTGLYAEEPLFTFVGIPFYYKVLIPLGLFWLVIMVYVLYIVFRRD